MPVYKVTDPTTGQVLRLTGDTPPTEQELEQIFASQAPQQRPERPQVPFDVLARQQAARETAEETGPFESGLASIGQGLKTVGRGLGFIDPPSELEKELFNQLGEKHPISTTVGEVAGNVAPFLIPGAAIGQIASAPMRVAAATGLGAAEGGIVTRGEGGSIEEQLTGAGIGGAVAGGAELLMPRIISAGSKLIRRVSGKAPDGQIIDAAGNPSPQLARVLQKEGLTVDDLANDAVESLKSQKAGVDPEQAVRAARFAEQKIPISKGEITQDFAQQSTEQRLLESASDPTAEQFRQWKLGQSNAVRAALSNGVDTATLSEETGDLIVSALTGRRKLLRTAKNELYKESADNAKSIGGIPLFTDSMESAIPDADTLEDLAITSPASLESLEKALSQWGLKQPTEAMISNGIEPRQLTIENFERFRKTLNAIERGDTTGASSVAIGGIKRALDDEVDNLAEVLAAKGVAEDVIGPLKAARKTVQQLRQEFSPQALTGRLIDVKRDGVTPVIESSQVYSKLASKAMPIENVRRLMKVLDASGKSGKSAIGDLQSTTMLDLIDAGFSTASRKIDGIPVFNPGAFKKRIKDLGPDKLNAIFKNNPTALKRINNIDRVSADLMTPSGAQPKGSASVLLDLVNRLGIISISSKIPGGGILVEAIQKVSDSGANRRAVDKAINASPELMNMIDTTFPGISQAIGIGAARATAPIVAVDAAQEEQE